VAAPLVDGRPNAVSSKLTMVIHISTRNMSGLYFWSAHFIVLLIFFISVLTITGQQIHVSKLPPNNEPPSDAETEARYLPGWQPAFYLTITIGIILTMYELLQLRFSTWRYFL